METLWENKSQIIDELMETLAKEFSNRTNEPEKCQRDLEYIYDAVVNDYIEDSNHYVPIIANKFWYMGVRQIVSTYAEFSIYELLGKKLIGAGADENCISKIIDTLISIIKNGPSETQTDSLVSAAWSARRCQRNWNYSIPVGKKDVVSLANIATTMPAKQAREYFSLVVSTDRDLNNEIRKYANDPKSDLHPLWQNNQVSAPVLFIWIETQETREELTKKDAKFCGNDFEDRTYSIGISSGAVALAANYMGYKTGFCRCYNGPPIQDMLEERLGFEFNKIQLMLGIGHPDESLLYNQCIDDDGNLQQIIGNPRNCKYYMI